ncbi:rac GTPase-activating protein 1 [Bacillus rossius redtenbacheri]|uniref:rac GTPase-activating protein 1 n=1 Tax=Bacillus rossius redtenbacheri TaxID=93214 RepID=UPI002FDCC333
MSVNLKLLPQLDELTRQIRVLAEPCEREFLEFARSQEKWRLEWVHLLEQYDRLKLLADEYKAKLQDSEKKLSVARKLLEEEQNKRRAVEQESLKLEKQLEVVRDAVFQGKGNDETREKLAFLNNTSVRSRRSLGRCDTQRLNTISEALDSTGSILSDLGCTHSEDELDTSLLCSRRPWKNFRAPKAEEGPSIKRVRRSADKKGSFEVAELRASAGEHLVATTTVTVERDGPITARSTIDAGPDRGDDKENHGRNHNGNGVSSVLIENLQFPGTLSQRSSPTTSPVVINYPPNKFNNRPHAFTNRTMLTPDTCGVCGSKIKFAKVVVRCKECRITCHMECKNQAPLPCIPVGNTPTKKGFIMVF